jgi:hypothetical protein
MRDQLGLPTLPPPADPKVAELEATLAMERVAAGIVRSEKDGFVEMARRAQADRDAANDRADAAEAELHRHLEAATAPTNPTAPGPGPAK